ncbi:MAG: hypothetical protein QM758_29965 [Armatimonas sp.]
MKNILFATVGILGIALTGCSSGSSGVQDIEGSWRRASIGTPGQAESAMTACPNSITVNGTTVTCGTGDLLAFRTDLTATIDLIDAPTGNPVRLTGSYNRDGSLVTVRPTQVATDRNHDGTFDASETVFTDPTARLDLNIEEVSDSKLLVKLTLDGVEYTALYNKQFAL